MARDYGPATGSKMPGFELRDQDGKARSLQSLLGPKGALILFFRSADW
jgi:peroxiredoxin